MKYYEVITKYGYVGKKFYIPIIFAVEAEDGKEAALKVRHFPRVKQDEKEAIIFVRSIRFKDLLKIKNMEKQDISCPRN